MADLGNISDFLKTGSGVADLSWLDVDAEAYREQDILPKQNLQIQPDLEALWAHEDKPTTAYLEPNVGRPRTMGDLSEAHGPLSTKPEDITRTARMACMQSVDPQRIYQALVSKYDKGSIHAASSNLTPVLAERGLLGRYYIAAEDFPTCSTGAKAPVDFVKKHAAGAIYVQAKMACANCIHAQKGVQGGLNCAVFHKKLVVQVPYTEALAERVEGAQRAKGKQASALPQVAPKERIRLALLAPDSIFATVAMPKPVDSVARLLAPVGPVPVLAPLVDISRERNAANAAIIKAAESGCISLVFAKEAFAKVANAVVACDCDRVRAEVEAHLPMATPVYAGVGKPAPTCAMSAEDLQQKTATQVAEELLEHRAAPVKALLHTAMLNGQGPQEVIASMRSAFSTQELQETKPLWESLFRKAVALPVPSVVSEKLHVVNISNEKQAAKQAVSVALQAGRVTVAFAKNAFARIAQAKVAADCALVQAEVREACVAGQQALNPRMCVQTAFRGNAAQASTSGITKREVVQATRKYLNEGLYGEDLRTVMLGRFDPRDITAAQAELRVVLANQGYQGIAYIDPSAYADYGHGCEEAMRLYRTRGVRAVLACASCANCVSQTKPGHCGKLNKALVTEGSLTDKAAFQKAIFATGKATEVRCADLVNNGHSVVQEFAMERHAMEMAVDIDPPKLAEQDVVVMFGGQGVKL